MPPTDAIFLAVEKPTNPMHIAGLHLFTPAPGSDADELRAAFATATGPVAPFFRRRAIRGRGGRWYWRLEPTAELSYHVRGHVLPPGAGMGELLALCAELHAQRLDRDRPLWQAQLISGLADGRFAVYFKMHHALGDGQQSQRLLRQTLTRQPNRSDSRPPWLVTPSPVQPSPGRDQAGLLSELAGLASVLGKTVLSAGRAAAVPRTVLNPATISAQRRFAASSWPLQRIRGVAKAAEVSTNDVVLAICGGALRRYLVHRDELPVESLVALVPVALRTNGPLGELGTEQPAGNSVGTLVCELGTDLDEPLQRLHHVHQRMVHAKDEHRSMSPTQVLATTAMTMGPLLLEPLRARSRPPFNLIISNVTSSPAPLYFNGARLDEVYPLSIPVDGQALNITCTTYARTICFGLTSCGVHVEDPERILEYLAQELGALEQAVGSELGRAVSGD